MKRNLEDSRPFLWAVFCLLCVTCSSYASLVLAQEVPGERSSVVAWVGPEGTTLPFTSFDEMEQFLSTAAILEVDDIGSGITKPKKLLLEKEGIQMNAIFRDIDSFKHRWESPKGMRFDFHDYCLFECAAYRLGKTLGISHIPPAVPRTLKKEDFQESDLLRKFETRKGSIQAWVENAFSEKERQEQNMRPPNIKSWAYQFQMLKLFDMLIFNYDRNQTNILIGPKWKIWFIDSTRAFAPDRDLEDTDGLTKCERTVWANLQSFDEEAVRADLSEFLNNREMEALFARRLKLVEYIQTLIDERVEKTVPFDESDLNIE